MTTETAPEILECNKLIAEFMEVDCWAPYWNEATTHYNSYFKTKEEVEGLIKGSNYLISKNAEPRLINLYYHSSWNELMPVVERIESMGYGCKSFLGCVEFVNCGDRYTTWPFGKDKKAATWDAVLEFIKWYNRQLEA